MSYTFVFENDGWWLKIDSVEQLKVITEEDRAVLINRYGGWHPGPKSGYKNWCHKDKLIFPDFKKNQIRVSKFPDGAHFYTYIDDLQVRDGDILKWNTYDEAYNHALAYINE